MSAAETGSHWVKDNVEEDRVEVLIRKSGCWDQHLGVVDCMGDKRDWRECQAELTSFKNCMLKSQAAFRNATNVSSKPVDKQE